MHTNGTYTAARPRPRPPRREFVTTICTEELGRYAGVGLTLEPVIEEELRNVRAVAPVRVEESDDLVIWEGNKIAALIRIGADGRPVVTRHVRATPPAGESDRVVSAAPATDGADLPSGGQGLSPCSLAASETRAAIDRFQTLRRIDHEVQQRCQEASHAAAFLAPCFAEPGFWQRWKNVASEMLAISEAHLCQVIHKLAATVGDHTPRRGDGRQSCRCSVIQGGQLYLVLNSPAGQTLAVVDLESVVRLDPVPDGGPTE